MTHHGLGRRKSLPVGQKLPPLVATPLTPPLLPNLLSRRRQKSPLAIRFPQILLFFSLVLALHALLLPIQPRFPRFPRLPRLRNRSGWSCSSQLGVTVLVGTLPT